MDNRILSLRSLAKINKGSVIIFFLIPQSTMEIVLIQKRIQEICWSTWYVAEGAGMVILKWNKINLNANGKQDRESSSDIVLSGDLA